VLFLGVVVMPVQATAEDWPALYDVTGVASDDVLNIRAEPTAAAEIIGTLAYDARDVEVIEADDRQVWGRVNTGEASGWASLAFLVRRPGQPDGGFPAISACYGTEPFWSLRSVVRSLTFELPDALVLTLAETDRFASTGRRDRFAVTAEAPDSTFTAVLLKSACTDGMSDRHYGISVEAVLTEAGQRSLWSGCCTLAP
jgi:uncharacterized membrane protein